MIRGTLKTARKYVASGSIIILDLFLDGITSLVTPSKQLLLVFM